MGLLATAPTVQVPVPLLWVTFAPASRAVFWQDAVIGRCWRPRNFNWIEEKTGIEVASKVRSYQGLLVHVFGRLAAAMFVRNVLPQSA